MKDEEIENREKTKDWQKGRKKEKDTPNKMCFCTVKQQ